MGDLNLPAKPKFFVFVIIVALIIIFVAAVAFSPKTAPKPTPTPTPIPTVTPVPQPTTLSFTVKSGVGVESIKVTNQNTGATIMLISPDLPATYTCTKGDTLSFNVTAQTGYHFNAWVFTDGTFQSQNPYTIKATSTFTMEAHFLMQETP